jgi:hypothetical protein
MCCHSFAYVAHFVFLRDVWIRTQRAAVAIRREKECCKQILDAKGFVLIAPVKRSFD